MAPNSVELSVAGACCNLLVIVAPALLIAKFSTLLADIPLLLWLFALATWCVLESTFSKLAFHGAENARLPWLPYSSGVALLVFQWIILLWHCRTPVQPALSHMLAGGLLLLTGVSLRLLAIVTLRQFFTSHVTVREHHRLITEGVYTYLRHPSELGLLLATLGQVVYFSGYISFAWWLCGLLPLSCLRMRVEDHLLARLAPEEFSRYRSRTPALLPLGFWNSRKGLSPQ